MMNSMASDSIRLLASRLTAYLVNERALSAESLPPLSARDVGLYQSREGRPRMTICRSQVKIVLRDGADLIADHSFAILVTTSKLIRGASKQKVVNKKYVATRDA
jgi:hypothetical protein